MAPTEQGLLIKSIRKDHHWSVRRLARATQLSAGYISQLETGARPVTARVAGKIADAFGMPPYQLLAQMGFLPAEHVAEATKYAKKALEVPSVLAAAREGFNESPFDWLVIDYLYMLGDDPYGTGWTGEPGNHADWSPLIPDAPEPVTSRFYREAEAWEAAQRTAPVATPVEGWDDLSDSQRRLVQQLVNQLRKTEGGDDAD